MQGKPIQGFENDYFITEGGDIIDLDTGKIKPHYVRGNETRPRVDLYKEGMLLFSIYVIDIMCMHFFGKFTKTYYTVNYKDNDCGNLSLSNLEIISNDNYVTTQQIKKPKKIYDMTVNGPVIRNIDEINQIRELNFENSKIKSELRKLKRKTGRPRGRPRKIQKNPENFFSELGG